MKNKTQLINILFIAVFLAGAGVCLNNIVGLVLCCTGMIVSIISLATDKIIYTIKHGSGGCKCSSK